MAKEPTSQIIPPPAELTRLGLLVVVDGDCSYFDDRKSRTAFAMPGRLTSSSYQKAMDIGMRRSGRVVYRPLCRNCRKCQPLRVVVDKFELSRSQKRAKKKCEGLFQIDIGPSKLDTEHVELYRRYQEMQHGKEGDEVDVEGYKGFLVDTITDTIELSWRDKTGKLIAVGILDVTPTALSTVYFYWDPDLRDLSLGIYSALVEIDLCRQWKKDYYYLGYLVPGSKTMSYKAQFSGAEVWDGNHWVSMPTRDLDDEETQKILESAEQKATRADTKRFFGNDAALISSEGLVDDEDLADLLSSDDDDL